jgi:hypothetical protein
MDALWPILLMLAVFLVFWPLSYHAERIPKWIRALFAIGPAVYFVYMAITMRTVVSMVAGAVTLTAPIVLAVQAWREYKRGRRDETY